jgi:2'-5' RNA ligase
MSEVTVPRVERLFVAIGLGEAVRSALVAARPEANAGTRVEPPENLHLTLHFLGPQPVDDVVAALAAVRAHAFSLSVDGLGAFDARDGDRVLWASVAGGEPLTALWAAVGDALGAIGFTPERRPWRPHITLARCKAGTPIDAFLAQRPPSGVDRVSAFGLYTSGTTDGRPAYALEQSFPLAG